MLQPVPRFRYAYERRRHTTGSPLPVREKSRILVAIRVFSWRILNGNRGGLRCPTCSEPSIRPTTQIGFSG
jgi:hypothetical protein